MTNLTHKRGGVPLWIALLSWTLLCAIPAFMSGGFRYFFLGILLCLGYVALMEAGE